MPEQKFQLLRITQNPQRTVMILFLGMEKDPALTQTYRYPVFEYIEIVFKSNAVLIRGLVEEDVCAV